MPGIPRRTTRVLNVVAAAVLAIVVLATVVESVLDYFAISLDVDALSLNLNRPEIYGVALVAVEEGGVPLPISGDLIIMYSATRVGRNPYAWLFLGLAFEVAALVGSSFLFLIARRWGQRLLLGAPGRALQLTPERIQRAEGWLKRWGLWAVVFGRQVPGFRVAVTVVAGSLGLNYSKFIAGVAIGAAFWVALFMTLGLVFGAKAEQLLGTHQNSSLLIVGAVILAAILYVVWRRRRRGRAGKIAAPT
jgi:LPXTG-motif cell wall-anchored protein